VVCRAWLKVGVGAGADAEVVGGGAEEVVVVVDMFRRGVALLVGRRDG
jgi:hypothetical protein